MVTVSGTSGSGKTTSARHVEHLLRRAGLPVEYLRFRFLPCFGNPRASKQTTGPAANEGNPRPVGPQVPAEPVGVPETRHRCEPLGLSAFVGYASRAVAFRAYRFWRYRHTPLVIDRYFFDNFANRCLSGNRERLYLRALHRLVPTPDLSILMFAEADTVVRRRPNLTVDRVTAQHRGYQTVRDVIPGIVAVSTDDSEQTTGQRLEELVSEALSTRSAR